MNNLRIIHDNAADRAVLTASSQAGALGPANLQRDVRGAVLRSTGPALTITATWATQQVLAGVALIYTNLSSADRMRVRCYETDGGSVPLVDTGWVSPCPEAGLGTYPFGAMPLGWNAYKPGGVNTWARGGGADGIAWFAPVLARQLVIDIDAPLNSDGYIEASRLVAGNYWSPEYNPDYGAQAQRQDSTESYRTAGGELRANVGAMSRKLSLQLSHLNPQDRARLMHILGTCGSARPLLFSLFPENSDAVLEQEHMLYGRMTNLDAVTAAHFNTYSAPLQIEGI